MAERHAIRLRLSRCRGGRSFELNALGVGVFRLHALFFALDEIVDGLGRLFLLGRRFGRQFFAERAVADACKFAPAHDDDADDQGAQAVQRAEPLDGEEHGNRISYVFCHTRMLLLGKEDISPKMPSGFSRVLCEKGVKSA